MKATERPPIKHKKGIQVVQPHQPHPKLPTRYKESEVGSARSMSRSRGISISRETGITIDKIYDPKHFLPPKSPPISMKRSDCEEMKTLTSVRSLKLISIFADSMAGSIGQAEGLQEIKEELPVTEFQFQTQKMQYLENRCSSPILKLNGTEEESDNKNNRIQHPFRPNLLKF